MRTAIKDPLCDPHGKPISDPTPPGRRHALDDPFTHVTRRCARVADQLEMWEAVRQRLALLDETEAAFTVFAARYDKGEVIRDLVEPFLMDENLVEEVVFQAIKTLASSEPQSGTE